jgi:hypothetical protein
MAGLIVGILFAVSTSFSSSKLQTASGSIYMNDEQDAQTKIHMFNKLGSETRRC